MAAAARGVRLLLAVTAEDAARGGGVTSGRACWAAATAAVGVGWLLVEGADRQGADADRDACGTAWTAQRVRRRAADG